MAFTYTRKAAPSALVDYICYGKPSSTSSSRVWRIIRSATDAADAEARYKAISRNIFVICEPLEDAVTAGVLFWNQTLQKYETSYLQAVEDRVRTLLAQASVITINVEAVSDIESAADLKPVPGKPKKQPVVLAQEFVKKLEEDSPGELAERAISATRALCRAPK